MVWRVMLLEFMLLFDFGNLNWMFFGVVLIILKGCVFWFWFVFLLFCLCWVCFGGNCGGGGGGGIGGVWEDDIVGCWVVYG